jgi:2-oxoacid:acceptor oxidoreductase delta subunit (pyruvate/2-ketoisovalerate family)
MKYVSDYIVPIGPEGLKIVNTGAWRTRYPVMDTEKCVKCGMCFMYCPVRAIIRKEDGSYEITFDYCKGCGICAHECRVGAIVMENVKEDDE